MEAQVLGERSEERWWFAELHRLRAVFLAAIGADEAQIEASFCEAISTANQQKSTLLVKRAEATYTEYRRQKDSLNLAGIVCPLPRKTWTNRVGPDAPSLKRPEEETALLPSCGTFYSNAR